MKRLDEHKRRRYAKLARTSLSARQAKIIACRYWNRMRREYPKLFAEMRALEAIYKPHR